MEKWLTYRKSSTLEVVQSVQCSSFWLFDKLDWMDTGVLSSLGEVSVKNISIIGGFANLEGEVFRFVRPHQGVIVEVEPFVAKVGSIL